MPELPLPLRSLLDSMPNAVLETDTAWGQARALVARDRAREALRLARDKDNLSCDVLVDLSAVDHLDAVRDAGRGERFELVYQLFSSTHGHRLRLALRVPAGEEEIDSVVDLWPSAGWLEREVWDLYGIHFRHHPDLRRLLLADGFEGHPLRKEFPKTRRGQSLAVLGPAKQERPACRRG